MIDLKVFQYGFAEGIGVGHGSGSTTRSRLILLLPLNQFCRFQERFDIRDEFF